MSVHDGVFDDCFYGFDLLEVEIFYYTGFSVTANPTTKVLHNFISKPSARHSCNSCFLYKNSAWFEVLVRYS